MPACQRVSYSVECSSMEDSTGKINRRPWFDSRHSKQFINGVIPMFNLTMLLHILEPITTFAARAYVIGGEIFTVTTILFGLNMLAGLMEKVYDAGIAVGSFYREYCHQFTKWATLRVITLVILASELSWLGVKYAFRNKHRVIPALDRVRNSVGDWFVYKSPILATTYN